MSYGGYPDLKNVKKILVIKLRQLGDVLLTGPVFQALQNHLPQAKVDAYVYTESIPLLEGHPAIHHLIGYDRLKKRSFFHTLWNEWALLRYIRGQKYDLVINLTEGDRGALAAFVSSAPIRVGFIPKGRMQKKGYTHLVKHCPTPRHTVEKNLDALRRIGIFPSLEERELFLLAKPQTCIDGPYVLIHPTSRWRFKCWPVLKMRAVVEALLAQGRKVVLSSGPDPIELEMVEQIGQGLPVVSFGGKLSLPDLASLIAGCDFLLCVDSLPFHMANALKKRVIALFGPTSDVTWGAWKNPYATVLAQRYSCRPCFMDGCGGSKYSDCLATLSVSQVLEAISGNPGLDRCVLLGRC